MTGSSGIVGGKKSRNLEAVESFLAGAPPWSPRAEASAAVSRPKPTWLIWVGGLWGRLLKRIGAGQLTGNRSRLLSVTERLDLGPKKVLLLVACGERRFLVSGGAESLSSIVEVSDATHAGHSQLARLGRPNPLRISGKRRTRSVARRRLR